MYPEDPRQNPYENPDRRPSVWLLLLIAVGVTVAAMLLGGLVLYLRDIFTARPLG